MTTVLGRSSCVGGGGRQLLLAEAAIIAGGVLGVGKVFHFHLKYILVIFLKRKYLKNFPD